MNRIIIAAVLLIALLAGLGRALNDPTPFEVAGAQEIVGTPVLQGPEFCPDVTGDGVVDIADVVTVVKGYGTVYYITDIGAVVADYGRVGYCL